MTIPDMPTGPVRLYALFLRLRPIRQGTLMPFSGEMVHGAFIKWLRTSAPDVAQWLHDGSKQRLFTCSSLHFGRPMQPSLKAEREHIHLPLDPARTYTLRLTLLLGELFPLFHHALTQFNATEAGTDAPPFIQLGKQVFLLEEVILSKDDPSGWIGFTSLTNMIEKAQQLQGRRDNYLTLEFASLTTFIRGNSKVGYGAHHIMFPLPQLVFQSLLRRWDDIAPPELLPLVQKDRIAQYLEEDGVVVIDHDIIAHHVTFTTHMQRGFLGTCTYQLRGPEERPTPEMPLTLRQQMHLLAQIAFYSGVGYKTAMGLGQARLNV